MISPSISTCLAAVHSITRREKAGIPSIPAFRFNAKVKKQSVFDVFVNYPLKILDILSSLTELMLSKEERIFD